jgi:aminoglycoside phosphotransferase (APT) family kinase protein
MAEEGPLTVVARALGWRVVRRCGGGEFGAMLVEDGAGRRAVLKAMPDVPPWSGGWAASVDLVERLRATGYPAPRYLRGGAVEGHLYTLQEEMTGVVPERLTAGHAGQLLALAERHAGMGGGPRPAAAPRWASYVRDALAGAHRPERVASLRASRADAARLADEVHERGEWMAAQLVRSSDVVHGDFHHRNVLVDGDRVTAVFDWEQATPGDWRYDVLWLAFWTRVDVRGVDRAAADLVEGRARELLTPAERAAYAGLTTLRILDMFAHHWPDRLALATGWCESLLAPAWRSG